MKNENCQMTMENDSVATAAEDRSVLRGERGCDGSHSRACRAGPGYVWLSSRRLAVAIGRQKINSAPPKANELLLYSFDGNYNFVSPDHVETAACS